MLSNRTLLQVLRQKPLQTSISQAPLRLITRTSPFIRPGRLHRRVISSTRAIARPPTPLPAWRSSLLRRIRNLRQTSTKHSPATAQKHGSQQALSLSERFKELSRKYGWAAVGVYFGLSVIDFPFCFLAMRLIGPDRIGEAEHAVVNGFWRLVGIVAPGMSPAEKVSVEEVEAASREALPTDLNGHKVKENASTYLQHCVVFKTLLTCGRQAYGLNCYSRTAFISRSSSSGYLSPQQ